jgi:hypothetical protein
MEFNRVNNTRLLQNLIMPASPLFKVLGENTHISHTWDLSGPNW